MMKHLAFLLLLSLAAVKDGSAETTLRAKTPSYSASHQRRELGVGDWWYTLLNLLHVPCDPHHSEEHPHGHCAHHSHHAPKKAFRSAPTIASRTMGAVACPAPAGTRPMGGQATSGPTRRAHRGGATRGRPATASETTVVPDRARRRSGASAPDSARWWPVPRCS